MMKNKQTFIIFANDWSLIPQKQDDVDVYKLLELAEVGNFFNDQSNTTGIYKDKDKNVYRTTGLVGIRKLRSKGNNTFLSQKIKGKIMDIAIQISPSYVNLPPWEMLLEVLQDGEYSKYIAEDRSRFFSVFYSEGTIKADTGDGAGKTILMMSFIMSCQQLCRNQLKKQMTLKEENLTASVRGSILLSKHLRENVVHGRQDKVFCKYPVFSLDTIENQILKKALLVSYDYIRAKDLDLPEIVNALVYCLDSFRTVKNRVIRTSDFTAIKVSGFNSSYKGPLELARLIIGKNGLNVEIQGKRKAQREVLPYFIKMESVFEFYIRAKIRQTIEVNYNEIFKLADYRDYYGVNAYQTYKNENEKDGEPYLTKTFNPDILILKKPPGNNTDNITDEECTPLAVFDVKYQSTESVFKETRRNNTHQLLFYTLLFHVKECGFIFPLEKDSKPSRARCQLNVKAPDREPAWNYSQWFVSVDVDKDNQAESIKEILKYLAGINEDKDEDLKLIIDLIIDRWNNSEDEDRAQMKQSLLEHFGVP